MQTALDYPLRRGADFLRPGTPLIVERALS
jgi:hypothetical protein